MLSDESSPGSGIGRRAEPPGPAEVPSCCWRTYLDKLSPVQTHFIKLGIPVPLERECLGFGFLLQKVFADTLDATFLGLPLFKMVLLFGSILTLRARVFAPWNHKRPLAALRASPGGLVGVE